MNTYQFMLRLSEPPTDEQTARLLERAGGACVEVGAFRRWAAVATDRTAPELAEAITATVRDLDAVGLVPVDAGPDDDIVSRSLVAERVARSRRCVGRWSSGATGPGGFPDHVELPSGPRYYRWGEIVAWLRNRMGIAVPDDEPVFIAVNLALRLRAIAPGIDDPSVIWSILNAGHCRNG